MPDGREIPLRKRAELELAYREGNGVALAARLAGVCRATAVVYYFRFHSEKLPRKDRRPRSRLPGAPIYAGPDWIGNAASSENGKPKNGAAGRGNF